MTGLAWLAVAAAAFVGTHFLLSHPLRTAVVRAVGQGPFRPGTVAVLGGTLLFFVATWLHPIPSGFWRWIG